MLKDISLNVNNVTLKSDYYSMFLDNINNDHLEIEYEGVKLMKTLESISELYF